MPKRVIKRVSTVPLGVSVPNDLAAFFRRYADARGVTLSRVVVELLQTARPALEDVLTALEAAEHSTAEALAILNRSLSKAAQDVSSLQGQLELAGPKKGGRSDAPKM